MTRWLLALLLLSGCAGSSSPAGAGSSNDAGEELPDAGEEVPDAGGRDAGTADAGSSADAGVRDAGVSPGWGQGTQTGSFSNDVWTPGRDTDGRVNAASWALVPRGRWVSVSDTKLQALGAQVQAAIPGWRDYGSQGWNGVTEAWNAPAFDLAGRRLWRHGGGHGDSSNNGIYRFDLDSMRWSIEHMPSDTNLWSKAYRESGTFAGCPESRAAYNAEVAAGTWAQRDRWYYDEIFWDRTASNPMGNPTARHVYDGFIYVPESNELVVACRRLWRYSLATHQWTLKSHPRANGDDTALTEEVIAVLDKESKLVIGSCGSSGPFAADYDLRTNTWLAPRSTWGSWDWSGGAYTQHGDIVTIFTPQNSSGNYASPGRWQRYSVATHSVLSQGSTWNYEGGLSLASFPDTSRATDGHGMVYVPSEDVYWVYTKLNTGMAWLELDLKTSPATLRPKTFANAAPALQSGIARRRAIYFPVLDAIVWMSPGDKDILVFRL
ncbi:hypothetical protein [Myxococcus stipitatus]|uniref:hypothetical protein n=1 Tax=Myxococcus stipitatus TaxID=83455 RepID=UPI0030CC7E7F